jgi:hypothetical protein
MVKEKGGRIAKWGSGALVRHEKIPFTCGLSHSAKKGTRTAVIRPAIFLKSRKFLKEVGLQICILFFEDLIQAFGG